MHETTHKNKCESVVEFSLQQTKLILRKTQVLADLWLFEHIFLSEQRVGGVNSRSTSMCVFLKAEIFSGLLLTYFHILLLIGVCFSLQHKLEMEYCTVAICLVLLSKLNSSHMKAE